MSGSRCLKLISRNGNPGGQESSPLTIVVLKPSSCAVLQASLVLQGKELGDTKVGPMAGGNEDHTVLPQTPAVF